MSEPLGFVSNITGGTPGLTSETAFPPGAPLGLTPFELTEPAARVVREQAFAEQARLGAAPEAELGAIPEAGLGATIATPEPVEPLVDAATLNEDWGIPGRLSFSNPLPSSVAQMINKAKRDEMMREANAALQPGGVLPAIERFGVGVLNTFLDPLELVANAVPVVGEARLAGMFARAGLEGLPLTIAARAGSGGLSGAAVQLPLVGLRYGLSQAERQDYGMMDAAADVLMGAAGGAILHPLLGIGRPLELPEMRAAAERPEVNEAAARAAVAQVLDNRPVEVSPILDAGTGRWGAESEAAWRESVAQASGVVPEDAARVAREAAEVPPESARALGASEPGRQFDPTEGAALDRWAEQARRQPTEGLPGQAPPALDEGASATDRLRIDAAWMKAASSQNAKGELDAKAAAAAVVNEVKAALSRGDSVTLNAEGRAIPIVAVRGDMMRDAEGKPWGSVPILFDPTGQRVFVEISPKGTPRTAEPGGAPAAAPSETPADLRPPEVKAETKYPLPAVPAEPERLLSFLRKQGGVIDDVGEIATIFGGKRLARGLIRDKGLPLDEATLRAWQAGYLPEFAERPTINDLLNAVEDDARGVARYSAKDLSAVLERERVITENAETQRIADQHGIDPSGLTRTQFLDRIAEAMSKEKMAREQGSFDEAYAAMLLPEERAELEQIEQAYANAQGDADAYAAAAACMGEMEV